MTFLYLEKFELFYIMPSLPSLGMFHRSQLFYCMSVLKCLVQLIIYLSISVTADKTTMVPACKTHFADEMNKQTYSSWDVETNLLINANFVDDKTDSILLTLLCGSHV